LVAIDCVLPPKSKNSLRKLAKVDIGVVLDPNLTVLLMGFKDAT
jgi:hypothetical protein